VPIALPASTFANLTARPLWRKGTAPVQPADGRSNATEGLRHTLCVSWSRQAVEPSGKSVAFGLKFPATNTLAVSGKRPLAACSAHDEVTERTQVLGPADHDQAVADPHDL
jgi:hypothetical protein